MPVLPKCQPCPKPPPYQQKPKDATGTMGGDPVPASSAKLSAESCRRHQNLTLHDWLTVFAYIDAHPDERQAGVVKFFQT